MISSSNPVDQLIEIGKQNQVLLSNIEANQKVMIEMDRGKEKNETRKFYLSIAKYVGWILMIYFSFVFSQGMVDKLMGGLTGGSEGGGINIESLLQQAGGGGDIEELLKNMK